MGFHDPTVFSKFCMSLLDDITESEINPMSIYSIGEIKMIVATQRIIFN